MSTTTTTTTTTTTRDRGNRYGPMEWAKHKNKQTNDSHPHAFPARDSPQWSQSTQCSQRSKRPDVAHPQYLGAKAHQRYLQPHSHARRFPTRPFPAVLFLFLLLRLKQNDQDNRCRFFTARISFTTQQCQSTTVLVCNQ